MNTFIEQFLLFIGGFVANVLASLSGGGAGFVQLPLLIFMGLPFSLALGTHKVAVVALGLGSLTKNHQVNNLNGKAVLIFLLLGCPAVVLGSVFVVELKDWIAEFSLGLITIASVIYSATKKQFGLENRENTLTRRDYVRAAFFTVLVGILSGSFSSGAGLMAIMVMVMCYRMDIKKAIHHSMILVAFIWNLTGAVAMGTMASIHWEWVPMLVLGAFLGGFTGTFLIKYLDAAKIKILFQFIMLSSGILLLYKAGVHFTG